MNKTLMLAKQTVIGTSPARQRTCRGRTSGKRTSAANNALRPDTAAPRASGGAASRLSKAGALSTSPLRLHKTAAARTSSRADHRRSAATVPGSLSTQADLNRLGEIELALVQSATDDRSDEPRMVVSQFRQSADVVQRGHAARGEDGVRPLRELDEILECPLV